ncbi:FmdB family transcriptional regulator [Arthrobacter sp. RIT-PI-e]|uniref:FmdB family zinc ribbon protein n=1 Tax=Arthrobacter sp. RIT-PI-e TaxID=1681197 RepID=UPI000675EBE3|nr:FmdB family zinc ribbon protein [Arthrobacter sp. RIT-PI-e]KNC18548.1 FmdB family transcriptional regulator [Arthrobacter sp. RIT-PI-e]
MPMYAYACKDCGHAFDIQQAFSDDSLTVCPECGGTLRKKFNSVGVVFKGSGFYRNDSRATSTSSEAGSTSGSASGSTSESAKESSPAASAKPAESSSSAPAPATSSTSSGSTAS